MYKAVSCDFYDEVINTITLHQSVALSYLDSNTTLQEIGLITDVFTKDKEEFCVINGKHIRLDQITELKVITNEK